jgi:hypothetical protein
LGRVTQPTICSGLGRFGPGGSAIRNRTY